MHLLACAFGTEVPFYMDAHFWIDALLALATGGLFFATYRVATRTKELATDTVSATRVADKHHQESLTPIVEWLCSAVTAGVFAHRAVDGKPIRVRTGSKVSYSGEVRNIGTGPALNVRAEFLFSSAVFDTTGDMRLPSLGPGQQQDASFEVNISYENALPETLPYTVTITYDNIFGRQCRTVHKNTGAGTQTETTFSAPDTEPRV